ncbi:MAG: antibiotic biosynthesis monooxygenase family protein [Bacteroidia bacterium]
MIVRIVRMVFQEDKLEVFQQIFNEHKNEIRHFPGCRQLELMKDARNPFIRYTHSLWEDESSLEAYRNSSVFKAVWPKTSALFSEKPVAYSLIALEKID